MAVICLSFYIVINNKPWIVVFKTHHWNFFSRFWVSGMERNFISYSHETTDSLNEPYDYSSIMHYNNKAFTSNGRDTMQSKINPLLRFGKRNGFSTVDIRQLAKLYSCPKLKKPSGNNYCRYCVLLRVLLYCQDISCVYIVAFWISNCFLQN